MIRIDVLSRAAVLDGSADGADAVISIRGALRPFEESDLDLAIAQALSGDTEAVLRLRFDDVGIEHFALDERVVLRGPTFDDVDAVIDFGRRVAPRAGSRIVLHCEQGRSRSSAAALALLADAFGPGHENEAVATLMRSDLDGMMHPNPRFVRMADAALLRAGRLESALVELCPRYIHWRNLWAGVEAGEATATEKAYQVFGFARRQRRRRK